MVRYCKIQTEKIPTLLLVTATPHPSIKFSLSLFNYSTYKNKLNPACLFFRNSTTLIRDKFEIIRGSDPLKFYSKTPREKSVIKDFNFKS